MEDDDGMAGIYESMEDRDDPWDEGEWFSRGVEEAGSATTANSGEQDPAPRHSAQIGYNKELIGEAITADLIQRALRVKELMSWRRPMAHCGEGAYLPVEVKLDTGETRHFGVEAWGKWHCSLCGYADQRCTCWDEAQ